MSRTIKKVTGVRRGPASCETSSVAKDISAAATGRPAPHPKRLEDDAQAQVMLIYRRILSQTKPHVSRPHRVSAIGAGG